MSVQNQRQNNSSLLNQHNRQPRETNFNRFKACNLKMSRHQLHCKLILTLTNQHKDSLAIKLFNKATQILVNILIQTLVKLRKQELYKQYNRRYNSKI